jgi:hypothetical protein
MIRDTGPGETGSANDPLTVPLPVPFSFTMFDVVYWLLEIEYVITAREWVPAGAGLPSRFVVETVRPRGAALVQLQGSKERE